MEALIPELKTRLADRKLQLLDLYLLMFETEDEDATATGVRLPERERAGRGGYHLDGRDSTENWEGFDYLELQEKQTEPFQTWLEIRINDKLLTTVHPSEHQRKQPARHQACLNWIEAYLQDALVSPEQRVKPEPMESKAELKQQTTMVMLTLQECAPAADRGE